MCLTSDSRAAPRGLPGHLPQGSQASTRVHPPGTKTTGLHGDRDSAAQARRGQNTCPESAWKPSQRGLAGHLAHLAEGEGVCLGSHATWEAEDGSVQASRPRPRLLVLQHRPVGAGAGLPSLSEVRVDQELDEDLPQETTEDTAQVRKHSHRKGQVTKDLTNPTAQ